MWIWCGLSMLSMIIGLFLFPNQNLDQNQPKPEKSLASAIYHRNFELRQKAVKSQFRERKRLINLSSFIALGSVFGNVKKSSLLEITNILGSFINVFGGQLHHRFRTWSQWHSHLRFIRGTQLRYIFHWRSVALIH